MRQAMEATRMATEDEAIHEKTMKEVLTGLHESAFNLTPPEIANMIHRTVRRTTGVDDPYGGVKKECNDLVLGIYPRLKTMLDESDDRLLTAVKLTIAGNIIDYGVSAEFNVEETIDKVFKSDFAINDYNIFQEKLDNAKRILYLGDNAGEIVFDRLLLEELDDKKIVFVVKGGPIINDATVEDARYAGLDAVSELDIVSNGDPGTGPDRSSREFISRIKNSDLVISKGQGNYEALSDVGNIFFLFMVKCPVIARDVGVGVGSIVLKYNQ